MLADLWHAPSSHQAVGTATTGSSEAIQLGGLAMKRLWQEKRKAMGKSIHEPGPNIVMGANAQVALEKFARYFDVECRLVPISVESNYCLDPKKAMEYVDENTIGIYVILGSTYTGHYEPVKEMSDLLDEYEKKTGYSVPIHGKLYIYNLYFVHLTFSQSTVHQAPSSHLLPTLNSYGTSNFLVLSLSIPLATNSASCTLAWVGSSGETRHTSPKTSFSNYITWDRSNIPSRSTFLDLLHLLSPSTSTCCISDSKVTVQLLLMT